MALPSINNIYGESLIMLTLGNIVLLSQLHPVWDWDQNLRATDFPSLRMVEHASIYWISGFPPILQLRLNIWEVWSWEALWLFEHTSSLRFCACMLWDAECCPLLFSAVLRLDPSRASGRQWKDEMDLGQSSVGTSGFGVLTSRELVALDAMCSISVRKYQKINNHKITEWFEF